MRSRHWPRLLLAVLLLGFEAAMLALGLFAPRVDPTYRALFIDHTKQIGPQETGRTSR